MVAPVCRSCNQQTFVGDGRSPVRHEIRALNHDLVCLFEVVVVSYSRKLLGQTGDGHYSPIGGYHRASDHVLILDVARFKRHSQL